MHRAGIAGITGRPKYRRSVRAEATASDLVDRRFSRDAPNQLWVTDITEHPTREGKVYCAVVLDTYSRRVVGWSIDSSPTAALVTNALGMAIQTRAADGTIIHSDHRANSHHGHSQHARRPQDSCHLNPHWARSATPTTTPWPSRSSGCSRPSSSVDAARGPTSRPSSSPCSSGSTGSTPPVCSSRWPRPTSRTRSQLLRSARPA